MRYGTRATRPHRGLPPVPREAGGGRRYLSDSARRGARRDTDSDRWPGHSLLRSRSRSVPGSQLRGNPGDNLGWSRVESSLKHGWVELDGLCSKASISPPERSSEPFFPRSAQARFPRRAWVAEHSGSAPKPLLGYPSLSCAAVTCVPGCLGTAPLYPAVSRREWKIPSLRLLLLPGKGSLRTPVRKEEPIGAASHACDCSGRRLCPPLLLSGQNLENNPRVAKPKVFLPPQLTVFAQGSVAARGAAAGSRPRVTGGVV